ncbi:YopX family protein [Streptococcus ferus]|uniref:YopX family protein n=1 Tax=Streptococcus ferus TaxID=1345 RepID=UPI003512A101
MNEMIPVHDIDFIRKMINARSVWRTFEEIILMQSTGLFDINGKEIFEGDVVNFEDAEDLENVYINQGLIEWCQGGFTVTNRATVTMADLLDGDNLEVTIIGNIYENPEW